MSRNSNQKHAKKKKTKKYQKQALKQWKEDKKLVACGKEMLLLAAANGRKRII